MRRLRFVPLWSHPTTTSWTLAARHLDQLDQFTSNLFVFRKRMKAIYLFFSVEASADAASRTTHSLKLNFSCKNKMFLHRRSKKQRYLEWHHCGEPRGNFRDDLDKPPRGERCGTRVWLVGYNVCIFRIVNKHMP